MDFRHLEQFEEIGRGGMGIVYKAWAPGANRWLVVKKLHPQLAGDPSYQKQIQREALSLSLLKHAHIVSFIDFRSMRFGEHETYGIVMDYIEGMNLKEWLIANGPPSFERLLPLFMEISSALAYLHQNNIFHLDLKPENILISHAGKPYLSDFGIASIQGELQNTSPLSASDPQAGPFGTLEYISPEQARGEPPDGRSDLYSLGMIFYTLIHGKSFFKGMEKTAVWGKIVYETHPFSLTFPANIPPYFQSVIRKLVEKDPSRRFPDVRQMLDQVRPDRPIADNSFFASDPQVGRSDRTNAISLRKVADKPLCTSSGERRVILAAGLVFIVVFFLIEKMLDPPQSRQTVLHFVGRVQSFKQPVIQEFHETSSLINSDVPPKCGTGCPQIEIVFLKKEKALDAPGEVRNGLSAPPLTKCGTGCPPLDDHELEEFLMEFKGNVEQKDLAAIEKEARLSSSGRERFQEIFRDSRAINMEFQQIKREGASIAVDFRVNPLIKGTLLFQDHSWHLQ